GWRGRGPDSLPASPRFGCARPDGPPPGALRARGRGRRRACSAVLPSPFSSRENNEAGGPGLRRLELLGQLRDDFEQMTDEGDVRDLTDGRVLVLVDDHRGAALNRGLVMRWRRRSRTCEIQQGNCVIS